jgi:hypothetical protein
VNGEQAYEAAYQRAERTPDGSVVGESLVKLIAELADFDADEQRLNHARRIVARRKRPGSTVPDGVVAIPGLEKFAYEPHRLISDEAGNVVENQHAKTWHKVAEARRAQEAALAAGERARQARREADCLDEWTDGQLQRGRDPLALTWGVCVVETGLLIEDSGHGAA